MGFLAWAILAPVVTTFWFTVLGGIGALQSFIVVTAAPVSLILLPTLWVAPRLVKNMARDQGLLASN